MKKHTLFFLSLLVVLLIGIQQLAAAPSDEKVKELEAVGVDEHLNTKLPLDLAFTDENGRSVHLRDYFGTHRPVLLTLNYYNCPMLCTLQLNGLVDALKNLNLVPGKDFQMVTVSFNPRETSNLARLKKDSYVKSYRPEAAAGWHFLVGTPENIDALTKAVGFRYTYDDKTQQYAHAATTMIVTPDGILSRYIYGVFFEPKDPQTLRLSLLEAADGKIGTSLDQILLFCYHYDPAAGSYSLAAMRLVRVVSIFCAIVLFSVLGVFWRREYVKSRLHEQDVNA